MDELSIVADEDYDPDPKLAIISFPAGELPKTYYPLIVSKWCRSLRAGNPLFKKATPKDYYDNYRPFITKLLEKPSSIVKLAVLEKDHNNVLGFSVHREDVLDYIYVNKNDAADYRMKGIGTLLFPEGITTFSHFTLVAGSIWRSNPKYKALKFNPFA